MDGGDCLDRYYSDIVSYKRTFKDNNEFERLNGIVLGVLWIRFIGNNQDLFNNIPDLIESLSRQTQTSILLKLDQNNDPFIYKWNETNLIGERLSSKNIVFKKKLREPFYTFRGNSYKNYWTKWSEALQVNIKYNHVAWTRIQSNNFKLGLYHTLLFPLFLSFNILKRKFLLFFISAET